MAGEAHPKTACRLYGLVAAKAPVALVLRRGPSDWWHLLQWDLNALTLTPGAWFHGTLYPRRCGISPDGRFFGYFALKVTRSEWPDAYFAVSRAPWLEALAAWETLGTWTWGCEFSESGDLQIQSCLGEKPFHGEYPRSWSCAAISTDWPKRDVWNELKRGWKLAGAEDGVAAHVPGEPNLTLWHEQPGGSGVRLGLIHRGVDFRRPGMEGVQLEYFLQERPTDVTPMPEVVWADWDHQGRLLVATSEGRLEVHERHGSKRTRVWSEDLTDRTPDPQPAPEWASRW
ncbi:MAG: hypothetical protein LAP40_19270 [Acidobacteriia bacterium]|nr:hypothetical protein [Terriglobia bacterium]